MKRLYLCSKPMLGADGNTHRHLIGILSQNDDNQYSFEYRLDDTPMSNGLILSIFPEKHKIYDDAETRVLLDDYLPSETDTAFMRQILQKSGLKEYDEWEWLRSFDSDDNDDETRLYETLPDDIIRHDISPDETNNDIIQNEIDPDTSDDVSPWDMTESDDDSLEKLLSDDFGPDESLLNNSSKDYDDGIEDLPFDDDINDELPLDDFESELPFDDYPDIEMPITDPIPQPAPVKPIVPKNQYTITIKKTVIREKQTGSAAGNFINPPPESPMELIQKRLIENEAKRKLALAEKLRNNPYK